MHWTRGLSEVYDVGQEDWIDPITLDKGTEWGLICWIKGLNRSNALDEGTDWVQYVG